MQTAGALKEASGRPAARRASARPAHDSDATHVDRGDSAQQESARLTWTHRRDPDETRRRCGRKQVQMRWASLTVSAQAQLTDWASHCMLAIDLSPADFILVHF